MPQPTDEKLYEKIKNELATGESAFDSPLNSPGKIRIEKMVTKKLN